MVFFFGWGAFGIEGLVGGENGHHKFWSFGEAAGHGKRAPGASASAEAAQPLRGVDCAWAALYLHGTNLSVT